LQFQYLSGHGKPPNRATACSASFARFCSIRGERFVGVEVQVALDGKAERAAQFANLAHADEAQLGTSHAEVCEAEGDVIEPELLGSVPGPRPAGQPKVCSKRLLPF
jgi:hypothetical protein